MKGCAPASLLRRFVASPVEMPSESATASTLRYKRLINSDRISTPFSHKSPNLWLMKKEYLKHHAWA